MMRGLYAGVKVPDLWRMSAQAETCPRDVKKQMLMRLGEIVNINANFKAQVVSHATKAVKNPGGQKDTLAPMDVNSVTDGGRDDEGWEDVHDMGKKHEVFQPRDDGPCRQRLRRESKGKMLGKWKDWEYQGKWWRCGRVGDKVGECRAQRYRRGRR